jgi:hypothetical protein
LYQSTIDDFIENNDFVPELIAREISPMSHWIRITKGCVPEEFQKFIDLEDNDGYSDLHLAPSLKERLLLEFQGKITVV